MCPNQMITKKMKTSTLLEQSLQSCLEYTSPCVEFELTTLVGIGTYYIDINNVFYPDIRSPPQRPQKTVMFDIIVTINGVVCAKTKCRYLEI
jgi:hypothetical protein